MSEDIRKHFEHSNQAVIDRLVDELDCEVVNDHDTRSPCLEEGVAVRFEGFGNEFLDVVCAEHAQRAVDRGALVIYAQKG